MTTAVWIQSIVRERPDLYRAIYDWNAYPHRWALPAWLSASSVAAPAIALLERTSRGRQRLSRHFTNALGLTEGWWDFQEPRRRLVLLPAASLQRIAAFAGAALHGARLARVIAKNERRALTERIGEDAYAFGLRQGRTLAAHGMTASPKGELGADIADAGWAAVAACLGNEDDALRSRFRMKVPPEIELSFSSGAELDATGLQAWNFILPIAREALSPEEAKCLG